MNGFSVPDEHYWNLGRVVTAASKLEAMAGSIVNAASTRQPENWMGLAGRAGAVRRGMKDLIASRPEDTQLVDFWTTAQELFAERNRLVHSLVELVFPESTDDPLKQATQSELRWMLIHPRTQAESTLPTTTDVDELVRRMNALSGRAIGLGNQIYRETKRDSEGEDI